MTWINPVLVHYFSTAAPWELVVLAILLFVAWVLGLVLVLRDHPAPPEDTEETT